MGCLVVSCMKYIAKSKQYKVRARQKVSPLNVLLKHQAKPKVRPQQFIALYHQVVRHQQHENGPRCRQATVDQSYLPKKEKLENEEVKTHLPEHEHQDRPKGDAAEGREQAAKPMLHHQHTQATMTEPLEMMSRAAH